MGITSDALDRCADYIYDNANFQDMLQKTFKNVDEEFVKFVTKFIIDSIVIESLSDRKYSKLSGEYGTIGKLKSEIREERKNKEEKDEYEIQKNLSQCYEIKQKMEESFSVGMSKFLQAFEVEFCNEKYLLQKIRQFFKNYKFKKSNLINDYTIFFFTFSLFDAFCCGARDEETKEKFAEDLSALCFETLHNPYNKKIVSVSSKSILHFMEQIPLEDYIDSYIEIFVKFVQAIYKSETLPNYLKYDFFKRFDLHIILINDSLESSKNAKLKDSNLATETLDNLKVNKFVSNTIQKLKVEEDTEEIQALLKEVQKNILWVTKNGPNMDDIPEKQIDKHCSKIYDELMKLAALTKKTHSNIFQDVLQKYTNLTFDYCGATVNVIGFICFMLNREALRAASKLFPTHISRNVFLNLFITKCTLKKKEFIDSYCAIIDDIRENVLKIIKHHSERELENLTNNFDLDKFDFPILSVSSDETSMRYAKQDLFSVLS